MPRVHNNAMNPSVDASRRPRVVAGVMLRKYGSHG